MELVYEAIDGDMRAFIEAVIAYAPVGLAPLRAQLVAAGTCDTGDGYIFFDGVAEGSPIAWPPGPGGQLLLRSAWDAPGPRTCRAVSLEFHPDGRLHVFDFLNDESGPMDVAAAAAWLDAIRPPPGDIALLERALEICASEANGAAPSDR